MIRNIRNKQSGITLIALVVTIIVLIILALITLDTVFGDNGLVNQAQNTRNMAEDITESQSEGINTMADEYANIMAEEVKLIDVVEYGDYVWYEPTEKEYTVGKDKTGFSTDQTFSTSTSTNLWRILYDDEEHGMQIVPTENVITLQLGTDGQLACSRAGYNNIIEVLNNISDEYINEYAESARSIGSDPANRDDRITTYYTVPSNWPGGSYTGFKETDTYYESDIAKMQEVDEATSDKISVTDAEYYLASRHSSPYYEDGTLDGVIFYIRTVNTSGTMVDASGRIGACSDGAGLTSTWMITSKAGVRPVIKLKDTVKIVSGTGTRDNPYIIKL